MFRDDQKWNPRGEPYEDPREAEMSTGHTPLPNPIPIYKYQTVQDKLFPGTWRVEPVGYTGRGIVYLFPNNEEARAWEKHKNKQFLESKRK